MDMARVYFVTKVKPFPLGCPTDGVKPPEEPEAEWKGLSRAEELRLLNAAQTLRVRPGRGTNQGLRDHVAIALLLGSGLRVSEVLNLNCEQYTGRGFKNVLTKGGRIGDFVPVQAQAREVREECVAASGQKSDRYIWRYVKPSQQSLAAAIDELDA